VLSLGTIIGDVRLEREVKLSPVSLSEVEPAVRSLALDAATIEAELPAADAGPEVAPSSDHSWKSEVGSETGELILKYTSGFWPLDDAAYFCFASRLDFAESKTVGRSRVSVRSRRFPSPAK
jgi:hypothetical protein